VSDEIGVPSGDRTWRPPLSYRVALTVAQFVFAGLATAFSWLALSGNQLHGEVVLAVTVPLWALFAFRLWTASATLAQDTLLIRNVLSTERVLVADITKVAFSSRAGALKVTEQRPPSSVVTTGIAIPRHRDPGERYTVTAVRVGLMASVSGTRCEADDAADLIAAAAGLPALPPRRAQVTHERALVMIPAGIALFALGAVLSTVARLRDQVGGGLQALGALWFIAAVIAELGRFMHRRPQPQRGAAAGCQDSGPPDDGNHKALTPATALGVAGYATPNSTATTRNGL
jgi:hypothetical protein